MLTGLLTANNIAAMLFISITLGLNVVARQTQHQKTRQILSAFIDVLQGTTCPMCGKARPKCPCQSEGADGPAKPIVP